MTIIVNNRAPERDNNNNNTDTIPFSFEGTNVRTLTIDNEPWFVLGDVCKVLGIGNVTAAKTRLDQHDFNTTKVIDGVGRRQQVGIINESGLYDVILDSRKPQAKRFRRWITAEVIPSIRKTGSYEVQPQAPEDEDILIARALIASNKKTLALEAKLEEVSPKVEFFDEYIDTGSLHSLHDAARAIGWRPNIFCQELREQGILQKGRTLPSNQPDQSVHNVAYQTYVNQGYFVNKTRRGTLFDGSPYHTVTSWMTPKGVAWIEKRVGQDDKKPRSARKPKEPTPNHINFNYVPSRFL